MAPDLNPTECPSGEETVSSADVSSFPINEETDSENEPEETSNEYELLPQEPQESDQMASNGVNSGDVAATWAASSAPREWDSREELPPEEKALPMDAEHIEKIKTAMSAIRLPSSSFPGWALEVSEDDLKSILSSKIEARKQSDQQDETSN